MIETLLLLLSRRRSDVRCLAMQHSFLYANGDVSQT
jgi:hypothetical protein